MKIGVIGAGLGGLCSAIKLAEEGHSVTVFDGAMECGGVLRSVSHGDHIYDLGTHFIVSSTRKDVNRLFIDPYRSAHDPVLFRGPLREGHFFAGKIHPQMGCPDLTIFPDGLLSQMQAEYLERRCASKTFVTAEERIRKNYGPTVLQYFFNPTLKKLTGLLPIHLSQQVIDDFHLNRVVLFDREKSLLLKKDPYHDDRLAFAELSDRRTSVIKFYPSQGYFGHYVEFLYEQAKAMGVNFRFGQAANELSVSPVQGCALKLADGTRYHCQALVWTVSPFLALKALRPLAELELPAARTVELAHFVCTEPTTLSSMWVNNFDEQFLIYRVTLYQNFRQSQSSSDGYPITVETVTHGREGSGDSDTLQAELAAMGICDSPRFLKLVGVNYLKVPLSKPEVALDDQVSSRYEVLDLLSERFVRVGAGRGISGQVAIMEDVYDRLDSSPFAGLPRSRP